MHTPEETLIVDHLERRVENFNKKMSLKNSNPMSDRDIGVLIHRALTLSSDLSDAVKVLRMNRNSLFASRVLRMQSSVLKDVSRLQLLRKNKIMHNQVKPNEIDL